MKNNVITIPGHSDILDKHTRVHMILKVISLWRSIQETEIKYANTDLVARRISFFPGFMDHGSIRISNKTIIQNGDYGLARWLIRYRGQAYPHAHSKWLDKNLFIGTDTAYDMYNELYPIFQRIDMAHNSDVLSDIDHHPSWGSNMTVEELGSMHRIYSPYVTTKRMI